MYPQSTLPIPPNDQVRIHRRVESQGEVFFLPLSKEISQYLGSAEFDFLKIFFKCR